MFRYKGVDIGVVLNFAVLIHLGSAANISFGNLQLVTISPKSSKRGLAPNGKEVVQKKGISVAKKRSQEVVVCIRCCQRTCYVSLLYSLLHKC
jgi:peroxin-1